MTRMGRPANAGLPALCGASPHARDSGIEISARGRIVACRRRMAATHAGKASRRCLRRIRLATWAIASLRSRLPCTLARVADRASLPVVFLLAPGRYGVLSRVAKAKEREQSAAFIDGVVETAVCLRHDGASAGNGRLCRFIGRVVVAGHGGEALEKVERATRFLSGARREGIVGLLETPGENRMVGLGFFQDDFFRWRSSQPCSSSSRVT